MVSTWIEAAAKGRHGGPVRAGLWSSVVVGTHPIELNQDVALELTVDDVPLGHLPAYWVENKGVNSLWHVPIPPQPVGVRMHYRSVAHRPGCETVTSGYQDTVVRPNLPDRTETAEVISSTPEGLIGNRMMTVKIDPRGSTYDVYYPTVGLHTDVRPAEGDRPQSRSNFRAIVGGLALGNRLDWFTERLPWEAFQHYLGATNLLMTELAWRNGPFRVLITDFCVMGGSLPKTDGGVESPGQYIKRFRVKNEGTEPRRALFGVYVHAEVNGGIGEPGLSWHDGDRTLLATNRGHSHVNRKLARDSTIEFAVAFDNRGEVHCETTGANEAILLRWLDLPAGETVTVDLLVSGAFTGWRGDPGTFEHWLRPALAWFRSIDLDQVEQTTALEWDAYVEPLPSANFPKPAYAVSLRRSALGLALHCDANWGAVVSSYDRGLSAYCWPREAVWTSGAFDRLGHSEIGRGVFRWLSKVRGRTRPFSYWFQKYTIDGGPEWETPAVDQSAMIPFGIERHYRRTGDLNMVVTKWPMIEQAAGVCFGLAGHPGLRWIEELQLVSSAGIWDLRMGAFLFSNTCVVAGLQAAARLATLLDKPEFAERWQARANAILEIGILGESAPGRPEVPGLVDHEHGRFLDARRLSKHRGIWTDRQEFLVEHSGSIDISALGLVIPFGLLPASDPRVVRTAEAILRSSIVNGDPNSLTRGSFDPVRTERGVSSNESHTQDMSSLATLWMARYLVQLGRETGQARHWNRAIAMLDGILGRLLPLGLSVRTAPRTSEGATRSSSATCSGSWGLHTMLVNMMLDLGGLDYDVPAQLVTLSPVLPSSWPYTGFSQVFPCGELSYRLERPIGGTVHQLTVRSNLKRPITLLASITCPGLSDLGPWRSSPETSAPEFLPKVGRLSWSMELPEGESVRQWIWG